MEMYACIGVYNNHLIYHVENQPQRLMILIYYNYCWTGFLWKLWINFKILLLALTYLSMQYCEFWFCISILRMYTIAIASMIKKKMVIHCNDWRDLICCCMWLIESVRWLTVDCKCCWDIGEECFPLCDPLDKLWCIDELTGLLSKK